MTKRLFFSFLFPRFFPNFSYILNVTSFPLNLEIGHDHKFEILGVMNLRLVPTRVEIDQNHSPEQTEIVFVHVGQAIIF